MKKYLVIATLFVLSGTCVQAQSDWDTYPMRGISELIQQEEGLVNKTPKSDIIISAQPFPSKTVVTYVGTKRPVDELTNSFIKLWTETKGLPAKNSEQLVEEYLFKEKENEYWIPVIKSITPYFEKELKANDEIMIYYFYLGGFNPKSLNDKSIAKTKTTTPSSDKIRWIFAVEEFQKPRSAEFVLRSLDSVIDREMEKPGKISGVWFDPRQMKSKTKLIVTGDVRDISGRRKELLDIWFEKNGFSGNTSSLMSKEARFTDGDKEYWIGLRNTILDEITKTVKKGEPIFLNSILVGGIKTDDKIDWYFLAGVYSR